MARGKPAFWSSILGIPFVISGLWLYFAQSQYPSIVGVPFIGFGLFIILIGIYVHTVSPSALSVSDNEKIVAKRHPTQRVATVKIVVGFPLLLLSGYMLYFTNLPYVYPTITFVTGLYPFSVGLYTYWANSLTTYYITSDRVVKEYRFISVIRQEIPQKKIRGVQERKSLTETLVGLGNVVVASGGGGGALEIQMQNMERSEAFAAEIRAVTAE